MEQLIQALLLALEQAGVAAAAQLPPGKMPHLRGPVAAVGLRQAKGLPQALYDYLGMCDDPERGPTALYGRRLEATLGMDVYCPARLGGQVCMAHAEKLADVLLGPIAGVQVLSFTVGACTLDREADCLVCPVTAEVRAYVYAVADSSGELFTDFTLKGAIT